MNDLVYLDRRMSNAIKGILIILIVFGHNHVLCPNTVSNGLMDYLYNFHIAGFFILPFFYDHQTKPTFRAIGKIIVRNWIPYTWICILCFICFGLLKHHFEFSLETVAAFFQGTQTPIKQHFGFVFPWFLPTYCSMSILLLFALNNRHIYWLLLILFLVISGLPYDVFYLLKNSVSFGLMLAIYYFGIGVLSFLLNKWSKYSKWIALCMFVVSSILYIKHISVFYLNIIFPISFFLSLLLAIPYINCRFLRLLGENSLGIYLLHMFLVNITFKMLPHTLFMGIIGFLISLFFPLLINVCIMRTKKLRMLLYPKNLDELCIKL